MTAAAERRLRIHDEAALELRRAADWYDERRAGLGDALVIAVDVAISKIIIAPGRWPRFAGARRYVLERFPYSIVFRFHSDQIEILAVAHHKRRPDYWQHRTELDPTR